MVKCSLTEFGRAGPDNKHWDDLRAKSLPVRPSHPVDKYILHNFFLFRSYAVCQYTNKNHNQRLTRYKKLIRTLGTLPLHFNKKSPIFYYVSMVKMNEDICIRLNQIE